jgi:hypothetical protein
LLSRFAQGLAHLFSRFAQGLAHFFSGAAAPVIALRAT